MAVDTSAILAICFNEPDAAWASEQMNADAGQLLMSTVNLAEALIRIRDRQPAEHCPILTLDQDFCALDVPVILP